MSYALSFVIATCHETSDGMAENLVPSLFSSARPDIKTKSAIRYLRSAGSRARHKIDPTTGDGTAEAAEETMEKEESEEESGLPLN